MQGNLTVLDSLISTNQTIAQFGEQNAFDIIAEALQMHNETMQELLGIFGEFTQERIFGYGGSSSMVMRRVDETGAVDVQKGAAGQTLSLPLYLYQIAIGWTRRGFEKMTTARLAAQFQLANDADINNANKEIRRALFNPTNNLNYIDRLTDNVKLELRALLNADGFEPPLDPNGNPINGNTHTHYMLSLIHI